MPQMIRQPAENPSRSADMLEGFKVVRAARVEESAECIYSV